MTIEQAAHKLWCDPILQNGWAIGIAGTVLIIYTETIPLDDKITTYEGYEVQYIASVKPILVDTYDCDDNDE